jgi:hypothetical protein
VAVLSELLDQGVKAYTRGLVEEAERFWRDALALDPRSERARAYLRQLHAEFPGRVGDPELLPIPAPPRPAPELPSSAPGLAWATPELSRAAPGASRSAPDLPRTAPDLSRTAAEASRSEPEPSRTAPDLSRTAPVVEAASAGSFGGAGSVEGAAPGSGALPPAEPPPPAAALTPPPARPGQSAPGAVPAPVAASTAAPVPAAGARLAERWPAPAPQAAGPAQRPPPAPVPAGPPGYVPSPWDDGPAFAATVVLDATGGLDFDAVEEKSDLRPLVPERRPSPAPPAAPKSDVEVWMEGARELFALGDFSGSLEMIEKILRVDGNHAEARAYLRQNEATLIAMYESKLGSLANVPRLAISPEEVMWLNLDHRAGFLLAQVDGSVNFEVLFALSGLPRLDTARILSTLLADGVIR